MNKDMTYNCTKCGRGYEKSVLTVKKVSFLEMGLRGRTLKSRVTQYLCPKCLVGDPHWNLPRVRNPFKGLKAARDATTEGTNEASGQE